MVIRIIASKHCGKVLQWIYEQGIVVSLTCEIDNWFLEFSKREHADMFDVDFIDSLFVKNLVLLSSYREPCRIEARKQIAA